MPTGPKGEKRKRRRRKGGEKSKAMQLAVVLEQVLLRSRSNNP